MRVLVTGRSSQLGRSIHQIISKSEQCNNFVFTDREELDFGQNHNIENYLQKHNFDIIINCAAYTAVDNAEAEKKLAHQVNYLAVKTLALAAHSKNITLIHISTDYVFNGKSAKAYLETDTVDPINTYGKTKLKGERAVQEIMLTNAIIIRTSWVYSKYGNNFVNSMLKLCKNKNELKVVVDQIGSPTYAGDLANTILEIIQHKNLKNGAYPTQIYHYSNMGECSKNELAKNIFALAESECFVSPITTEQYPTAAKRPLNTLMSKNKIMRDFDIKIPHWKNSLSAFITLLKKEN